MTLLQEYIVQQPALWRALLDSREEITGAFARRFGDRRPARVGRTAPGPPTTRP